MRPWRPSQSGGREHGDEHWQKAFADTLALDPPQWEIGDLEIKLDGFAYAAGYDLSQASSGSHAGVTGQSRAVTSWCSGFSTMA